jgi:GDPmannose 4,6-dehydratase
MSSIDHIVPSFAKLNLPSVEEYQKRKVALISGKAVSTDLLKKQAYILSGITGQDGSYL